MLATIARHTVAGESQRGDHSGSQRGGHCGCLRRTAHEFKHYHSGSQRGDHSGSLRRTAVQPTRSKESRGIATA